MISCRKMNRTFHGDRGWTDRDRPGDDPRRESCRPNFRGRAPIAPQILSVAVAFAVVLLAAAASRAAPPRPNVVIVLVDDFGWGDLSCYGDSMVETPNIDRMANEGIRFTQGYVASPICSPSRCALITGQYPGRWRITSYLQTRAGNRASEMVDYLDPAAPSLPRILKEVGYATAHIGKWHLGGGRDVTDAPKFSEYGYDVGLGTWESPEPHPDITSSDWIWADTDPVKRHERTRWMVDETLKFAAASHGKPYFINLWLDDTHTPFVPSEEQLAEVSGSDDRPRQKNYKAVMRELDRQIGRLLEGLAGTNTLVLLVGDNGAAPTFGQRRVGGLRGQKLSLYEGGIRVPFLVWWPEAIKRGVVNDATVISTVDLLPSLAKICGGKLPPGYQSDGELLDEALVGQMPKRRGPLFWEYGRNDTFSYPAAARHRSPNVAVREGNWKLLVNGDGGGAELYDLGSDPRETRNVASAEAEVAGRLSELALRWRKSLP